MSVKKQAAAYLLSVDPETERLQVRTSTFSLIQTIFVILSERD